MHALTLLTATLSGLALASAKHHTSSYSYSNLETLYTSMTDWQGVVTGQPTSHPPIVTSFPSKIMQSMLSLQSAHDASALSVQGAQPSLDMATVTHVSPGLPTLDSGSGSGSGHGKGKGKGHQSSTAAAHRAGGNAPAQTPSADSGSDNDDADGDNAGAQVQAASVGTLLAAAVAAMLFA